MIDQSSGDFGDKLVQNLCNALLFDRSDELVIDTKMSIKNADGSDLGDIDAMIKSTTGFTTLQSLLPPGSSRWHPNTPRDLHFIISWWEFKRSCAILRKRDGTFQNCNQINSFIGFYIIIFHEMWWWADSICLQ